MVHRFSCLLSCSGPCSNIATPMFSGLFFAFIILTVKSLYLIFALFLCFRRLASMSNRAACHVPWLQACHSVAYQSQPQACAASLAHVKGGDGAITLTVFMQPSMPTCTPELEALEGRTHLIWTLSVAHSVPNIAVAHCKHCRMKE